MPDPDFEIRGGVRSSRPLEKGGGERSPKNFFGVPLRAHFGLKIRGNGPDQPGPSPGPATVMQRSLRLVENPYAVVIRVDYLSSERNG